MNLRAAFVIAIAAAALPAAIATPAAARQVAGTSTVPSSDLAAARALYASASYEEALGALSTLDNGANAGEIEELRALCFLALGRLEDAEQALERIVRRQPLYQIKEGDVTPKLVTMFQEVRRRVLPGATRDLYARAKADFDAKNYTAAVAELKTLLALVGDPDLAAQAASMADLKMLGEGFLKLAEAELAAGAKPPAAAAATPPPVVNAPPAVSSASPAEPTAARIYSRDDKDVKPPVAVTRPMPVWKPPNPIAAKATFRGILEVVVDEQGGALTTAMRQSVNATYDKVLVEAARSWRFQPAMRGADAVRYRLLIEIALSPGGVK